MRSTALALVSSAMLLAQQTPPQTPVFRGSITIVPLAVTVLDKNGKPVTDLKQSDFTIIEDGAPQQIKTFFSDERRAQETPLDAPKPAALVRPAPFGEPTPAPRRTFLLILGYGRVQVPAKAADGAIEFIRTHLLPQDLVAVMAFNRVTNFVVNHELAAATVERFKDAHEAIFHAIEEFYCPVYNRGKPIPDSIQTEIDAIFQPESLRTAGMRSATGLLTGSQTFQQDRATAVAKVGAPDPLENPLDARVAQSDLLKFYAGVEYLRFLDGDKHLIWMVDKGLGPKGQSWPNMQCAKVPTAPAAAGMVDLAGGNWTVQEDEKMARRAADAGVTADIIRFAGIAVSEDPRHLARPRLSELDHIQSSEYIAELTGGQFTGVSYAADMLRRIDDATRFSYMLGYTPTNPNLDDRYRKVQVTVNRPGVTVLYRHGYTATAETRPLDLMQLLTTSRLSAAAAGEEDSEDIKLQAKASVVAGLGSSRRAVVDLTIEASRLAWGQDGDEQMASLAVKAFCGGDTIVGELDDTLDFRFNEADYNRVLKSGIRTTIRVPINGEPKYVKVLVYDYRADLLGTATVKLK